MKEEYLRTISFIERLHRRFLEVIKSELDRRKIGDVNNIQALMLYNIGQEQLTIGELTQRGCYLGSNVSYNVKKLVGSGYLEQRPSVHDKRVSIVQLSPKGKELWGEMDVMYQQHAAAFSDKISGSNLQEINQHFAELESFWSASKREAYVV